MDDEKDLQQPESATEDQENTATDFDINWLKGLFDDEETTENSAPTAALTDSGLPLLYEHDSDKVTTVFHALENEQPRTPPAEESRPVITQKKFRPKSKDSSRLFGVPRFVVACIWLALIVAIGVSLGRLLWVCCADVMAFGKGAHEVTITISPDDDIDDIADKLGQAELVRYPGLFKLFAKVTGKGDNISSGTFTLNATLDYNAMINAMIYYGSTREVVDIMFPEGATCAQIFKLLEENRVCTVEQLEEYAANGELNEYWFLEGITRGSKYCLEGYLAPDTYRFYTGDSPRRVLEKFLNEFDSRFTNKMKNDFMVIRENFSNLLRSKGFSETYIQKNTLTVHKVVTLASIIQKETSSRGEGYDIASVFYNRLANKDILTLGADATVHYALGDYFMEIRELTAEHLNFDSPYNTRKNQGIPPGPICNTDVHSLYAALVPNNTNYHYFVYDPSISCHRFAATYQEHMENISEIEKQ